MGLYLYQVKSKLEDVKINDRIYHEVPVIWFVVNRRVAVMPYAYEALIPEYDEEKDNDGRLDIMKKIVNELFNLEEAEKLRDYLVGVRNMNYEIVEIEDNPIPYGISPFGQLLDSPQNRSALLNTYEDYSYNLPFKVCGYYSIGAVNFSGLVTPY